MTGAVPRRVAPRLVLLALVVTVGWAAAGRHHLVDLTAEQTLTLTAPTRAVLDRVDRDVEVTAFVRHDEPGRVEAAALLDRYRKETRRLRWELVDPDDAPGEAARLGVDPLTGGVALRAGDDVVVAPTATEPDLTAGLARLLADEVATVCFTTGHGERALPQARELLRQDGYEVTEVDLLAGTEVPDPCAVVVVADPSAPLGDAAAVLADWTEANGKLLVLADPANDVDLSPMLSPYGLRLVRGVVFEGDPQAIAGGDLTSPIVRTYSSAHPIVARLAPTYFPGVQAVEVDEAAEQEASGLTVSRLADTSPASYLETEPVEAVFEPGVDLPGPVTVAGAADRSRVDGERITRSRVVAVGDADFADAFLGEAANATLWLRSVGWLARGDDVAAISPHLPTDRPLRLTEARVAYARLLTAGLVPALFLVSGSLVWAIRRTR